MITKEYKDSTVPAFSWDRNWSVSEIKQRLTGVDHINVLSWIMREAKFEEVWFFSSPSQVFAHFDELKYLLGRKRLFWEYILNEWHELGKI